MWNVEADSTRVSEVMAACSGGLQAVLGDRVGLVLNGEGAELPRKRERQGNNVLRR
jgi:hypothetical protein